jgi:hypothetical protein
MRRLVETMDKATGQWYEPPYDSPIEDIFAWHCCKHLRPSVNLEKQVELATQHGSFRADFILAGMGRRIEIECDGRDFHDAFRDEFRDAIVLGEGHVDTIYRFRGCDITYYPDDCVWLISSLHPNFFTKRGHLHLERLRTLQIPEDHIATDSERLDCLALGADGDKHFFRAFRRTIYVKPQLRCHWKVLYAFACEHPDAKLDELLALRMSS